MLRKLFALIVLVMVFFIGCEMISTPINPDENQRADQFELMWDEAMQDTAYANILKDVDTTQCVYEQFDDIMLDHEDIQTKQALTAWKSAWAEEFPDLASEPDLDIRFFYHLMWLYWRASWHGAYWLS